MKKRLLRAVAVAAALVLFSSFSPARALGLSAEHAILMDAGSGRVLYEKNADSRSLIASTTKIMTALVICEQCNVLDGFVDFAADTAGGSLKSARAAAVLVEYLSCADIDASTAADWMTDLTQDQRDLLDINWAGILANAQNIAADPASQTDLLSCAGVTTDFTGMVLTGVPDKLVILNTVFTGKAG